MSSYKAKGFLSGILASVSYGTNPLFALPMYSVGMNANSVLLYRYLFAVIIYGVWLKFFKKIPLKITVKEFFVLFILSILFAMSSVTLFESFNYMDSGLACTILFIYPIIVTIISALFFKEKITKTIISSIIMTTVGILLLYGGSKSGLDLKGVLYVLVSALSYAIYIVGVKNIKIVKHIKSDKLSFYVMLLGLSVFILNLKFCTELQPISNLKIFACAVSLAIFPTIISLETINVAIRLIGATTTAILGALEPLTAIFFGVIFFDETLSVRIILGIILIISGVVSVVLRKK